MLRKTRRTPSYYRLHKPSGQARVIINGEHVYLGKFDSPESREKYHRLVAEWLASGNTNPSLKPAIQGTTLVVTVNELLLAFWRHVKQEVPQERQAHQRAAELSNSPAPATPSLRRGIRY